MGAILNFTSNYGLLTLLILVVVFGAFYLGKTIHDNSKNKKLEKKLNTMLNVLEKVLDKNTCEEEVHHNNEAILKIIEEMKLLKESLKIDDSVTHQQTATLGQMIGVIFENSTLPVETKERLRTLKTKIEYASDSKVVEDLLSENNKLKKNLTKMKNKIDDFEKKPDVKIVRDVAADTVIEEQKETSHIVIQ